MEPDTRHRNKSQEALLLERLEKLPFGRFHVVVAVIVIIIIAAT